MTHSIPALSVRCLGIGPWFIAWLPRADVTAHNVAVSPPSLGASAGMQNRSDVQLKRQEARFHLGLVGTGNQQQLQPPWGNATAQPTSPAAFAIPARWPSKQEQLPAHADLSQLAVAGVGEPLPVSHQRPPGALMRREAPSSPDAFTAFNNFVPQQQQQQQLLQGQPQLQRQAHLQGQPQLQSQAQLQGQPPQQQQQEQLRQAPSQLHLQSLPLAGETSAAKLQPALPSAYGTATAALAPILAVQAQAPAASEPEALVPAAPMRLTQPAQISALVTPPAAGSSVQAPAASEPAAPVPAAPMLLTQPAQSSAPAAPPAAGSSAQAPGTGATIPAAAPPATAQQVGPGAPATAAAPGTQVGAQTWAPESSVKALATDARGVVSDEGHRISKLHLLLIIWSVSALAAALVLTHFVKVRFRVQEMEANSDQVPKRTSLRFSGSKEASAGGAGGALAIQAPRIGPESTAGAPASSSSAATGAFQGQASAPSGDPAARPAAGLLGNVSAGSNAFPPAPASVGSASPREAAAPEQGAQHDEGPGDAEPGVDAQGP